MHPGMHRVWATHTGRGPLTFSNRRFWTADSQAVIDMLNSANRKTEKRTISMACHKLLWSYCSIRTCYATSYVATDLGVIAA